MRFGGRSSARPTATDKSQKLDLASHKIYQFFFKRKDTYQIVVRIVYKICKYFSAIPYLIKSFNIIHNNYKI